MYVTGIDPHRCWAHARYNATAPIEALQRTATTRPDARPRTSQQAEGNSRKEARRALKRRTSGTVYRHIVVDSRR